MDTLVKPLRMLRSGRSSELWLVTLEGLGKAAVEKRFRPELVSDPASLFSSLRAASEARDEALIRVFDVDLSNSTVRQWMEHVPGESVSAAVLRARRLGENMPIAIAARIVIEAARGLHRAHEHGRVSGRASMFVHGAISSSSVLLGLSGEVKVLELGAGSVVLRGSESLYLAPELAQGRAFDRRVDVFALGTMLRELLVGQKISPELTAAIDRAQARNPDTRHETADELANAIRESCELADRTTIASWLGNMMAELDTVPAQHRSIPPPAATSALARRPLGRQPSAAPLRPATTAIGALYEFAEDTTTTKRTALDRLDLADSTDPSNAALLDPGTSTQDRVDLDHTVSREVSGTGSQAIAVQEARKERRGRAKKRRSRRAVMWSLAAACVPLIALLAWMLRLKLIEPDSARPAVPIDVRAFGSERRFDRAQPLRERPIEPMFAWGKVEVPDRAVPTKTRTRTRQRRREEVEVPAQPAQPAQPEKLTGKVSVSVLRGGRSSRMLVYVDGKPLLQSPSAIELSPGAHVLEIRPKGKAPIKRSVDVKAGADFDVTLDAGEDVE